MSKDVIAIGSDHGGFGLKDFLTSVLTEKGHEILDMGTDDPKASVDYPDFAYALAKALKEGKAQRGVLICGSGIGISIAANRHPEIRAALIHDSYGARMCREHNDANVICFGGRVIGEEIAKEALEIFLDTAFEGGRHARRVEKLSNPDV